MSHPKELIARIKGALSAGLGPKLIAKRTGIPESTIKKISRGLSHPAVEADSHIADQIAEVILRRNRPQKGPVESAAQGTVEPCITAQSRRETNQ